MQLIKRMHASYKTISFKWTVENTYKYISNSSDNVYSNKGTNKPSLNEQVFHS